MSTVNNYTQYDPYSATNSLRPYSQEWIQAMGATTPEQVAQLNADLAKVPGYEWIMFNSAPNKEQYNQDLLKNEDANIAAFQAKAPTSQNYSSQARFRSDGSLYAGNTNDYLIEQSKGIKDPWYEKINANNHATNALGQNVFGSMAYDPRYTQMTPDEALNAWGKMREANQAITTPGWDQDWPIIVQAIMSGVGGVATQGTGIIGAAAQGAASGAVSSAASGGNVGQGAMTGAATGAASNAIGAGTSGLTSSPTVNALLNTGLSNAAKYGINSAMSPSSPSNGQSVNAMSQPIAANPNALAMIQSRKANEALNNQDNGIIQPLKYVNFMGA